MSTQKPMSTLKLTLAGMVLLPFAALAEPPAAPAAAAADLTPLPLLETAPAARMTHSCLHDTGSHIRRGAAECIDANGRVYGREDLDSTGATSLGEALYKLDPSVTVTHH